MWAVTFVPNATGKDGVFSVVTVEQLTQEHGMAFYKRQAGMISPLCDRAELILCIAESEVNARNLCTGLQNSVRD